MSTLQVSLGEPVGSYHPGDRVDFVSPLKKWIGLR